MAKSEEPNSAVQGKKKRSDDDSMLEDVTSKPLQLQRRRVWRACESCRYVHPVLSLVRIATGYVDHIGPAFHLV